eukprot:TRINITY_DN24203_c0_g1_i2.p1 TRINITY_DN24203_c0_g1~~TRINITY_DN24203_c0_g1_i2.p1  ORF type:complete len:149 (+),score=23.41 TRINITY_DN24203_c0_g1_i2:31-477(+)
MPLSTCESLRGEVDEDVWRAVCKGDSGVVDRRLFCWNMMGGKVSEREKAVLCADGCDGEEVKVRKECFDRVMWRGRTDRKYEISEHNAALLVSRVRTRGDSESVQTCWKDQAFNNYRNASQALPVPAVIEACRETNPEVQKLLLASYS